MMKHEYQTTKTRQSIKRWLTALRKVQFMYGVQDGITEKILPGYLSWSIDRISTPEESAKIERATAAEIRQTKKLLAEKMKLEQEALTQVIRELKRVAQGTNCAHLPQFEQLAANDWSVRLRFLVSFAKGTSGIPEFSEAFDFYDQVCKVAKNEGRESVLLGGAA